VGVAVNVEERVGVLLAAIICTVAVREIVTVAELVPEAVTVPVRERTAAAV